MNELLPRAVAGRLTAALRVMPAVVVTGARHTGSEVQWLAPDVLAAPWWRVV